MSDLDATLRSLREFSQLEAGWDTYDALPIDTKAIGEARAVVVRLAGEAPIPQVTPRNDGSVELEWENTRHPAEPLVSMTCTGSAGAMCMAVAMIPGLQAMFGDTDAE